MTARPKPERTAFLIRLTTEEHALLQAAAVRASRPLSSWARLALLDAAEATARRAKRSA